MISNFFEAPELALVVKNIEKADEGTVIIFDVVNDGDVGAEHNTIEGWEFVQTEVMTRAGIAVHKYGAYVIPKSAEDTPVTVSINYRNYNYIPSDTIDIGNISVGSVITLTISSPGV